MIALDIVLEIILEVFIEVVLSIMIVLIVVLEYQIFYQQIKYYQDINLCLKVIIFIFHSLKKRVFIIILLLKLINYYLFH
jgi:hypothetical protein